MLISILAYLGIILVPFFATLAFGLWATHDIE